MKKNKDNPEQFREVAKHLADQFHHDCKALELWKRLFEWTDSPYEEWEDGSFLCFFCGTEESMPHAPDCIWIEAKKLVEENK